jgi:type IV pilus assembly protein PilA
VNTLRHRLTHDQDGFTLIELLVVIVIIGILLAIAVPSYLGFRGRAQDSKAESNIRQAVPAAEAYYADNNTYVGMTKAGLAASYDSGLNGDAALSVYNVSATAYCLSEAGQSGTTWYDKGPGGSVTSTKPGGC